MPRTRRSAIHAQIIGQRIRAAREAVGLTQLALAERMEVSQPVIAALEAGRGNPTVGLRPSLRLCRSASTSTSHCCRPCRIQASSLLAEFDPAEPLPAATLEQSEPTARLR
ncbi:MAG TPA: helix-turn-helix transcriptional regulator [Solirubrobacteraceae bacterium]|jgi:transcriptional regulator with XRE-family HTH domain|nr:helix-turn-helix transcriptional regulator [Solirubrobacteraceae bacterium]